MLPGRPRLLFVFFFARQLHARSYVLAYVLFRILYVASCIGLFASRCTCALFADAATYTECFKPMCTVLARLARQSKMNDFFHYYICATYVITLVPCLECIFFCALLNARGRSAELCGLIATVHSPTFWNLGLCTTSNLTFHFSRLFLSATTPLRQIMEVVILLVSEKSQLNFSRRLTDLASLLKIIRLHVFFLSLLPSAKARIDS